MAEYVKLPSGSAAAHNFAKVPTAEIERSSFDRSHGHKTTFDSGYLVPVFVDEVLPGDTFKLDMTAFVRMQTPKNAYMDNIWMDTFFFFVPNRLLWSNWEKMNGAQTNPGDSTAYLVPIINSLNTGYTIGSIFDYMGLPTGIAASYAHSALPLRAYNLIYNQWFRDENLVNSLTINTGDGPDAYTDYTLQRAGKRHDYFTSCLPWPQKGTAVSLPLGSTALVKGWGIGTGTANAAFGGTVTQSDGTTTDMGAGRYGWGTAQMYVKDVLNSAGNAGATHYPMIYADLTTATAATINDLRLAFQTQKMLERDARGGTRYTEVIKAHFGVTSPDARMQRPEYLGGGTSAVNVHPVPQTSASAGGTPQGNVAAFATSSGRSGFTKSFTEHGQLIGLVRVRADMAYQQGLNRMWSRRTRYDHYWPALAHIGEQAVLNKEIYLDGSANDALTFGYQERYGEYRYKPSLITGKFRSTAAGTLDSWHVAQKYTGLPVLNSTFIAENPPIDRVVAVTTDPQFYFDSYFRLTCVRPMPVFGVPEWLDHF